MIYTAKRRDDDDDIDWSQIPVDDARRFLLRRTPAGICRHCGKHSGNTVPNSYCSDCLVHLRILRQEVVGCKYTDWPRGLMPRHEYHALGAEQFQEREERRKHE